MLGQLDLIHEEDLALNIRHSDDRIDHADMIADKEHRPVAGICSRPSTVMRVASGATVWIMWRQVW